MESGGGAGSLLPDPVVLAGVLVKVSDHPAKSGAQTAYRFSLCRQLQVDTRPSMDSVKTFAEMLQAEAEEMLVASATTTTSRTSAPTVKAMVDVGDQERGGQECLSVLAHGPGLPSWTSLQV